MRKLAHVEIIKSISPIKGADRIETATVLGWQCVVKKGEFNVGDKVIFVEVDSIMPRIPQFDFLADKHYRVRAIRLRKQISQGLILPAGSFSSYPVGEDVTKELGIIKYEPKQAVVQGGVSKFPEWIHKTDEERVQNLPEIFEDELTTIFDVTEKLDGQSATYFIRKVRKWFFFTSYELGVCSRNLQIHEEDNSSYWKIFRDLDIGFVLRSLLGKGDSVVLQGEIVGQGIQGNKYILSGIDFYAFNLIKDGVSVPISEMIDELSNLGVNTVPYVLRNYIPADNVEELLAYANGESSLNYKTLREGLVFRNNKKNISFKVISPEFLVKTKS